MCVCVFVCVCVCVCVSGYVSVYCLWDSLEQFWGSECASGGFVLCVCVFGFLSVCVFVFASFCVCARA